MFEIYENIYCVCTVQVKTENNVTVVSCHFAHVAI